MVVLVLDAAGDCPINKRKNTFDSTHHVNSHNLLLTVSDMVALALAGISVLLAVHV